MKNKLNKIFKNNNNIIIGVIHFPPLLSYNNFPGFKVALRNALKDLSAFENGGIDGIVIENNYDIPHKQFVDPPIISAMTFLGEKIRKTTKLPLGISVLWNDYQTSLSIAKVLNLQFVRIPVFIDKVKTDCGIIEGQPKNIIKFQKSINAENIAILTDIHVKHSTLLSDKSIINSAKLAIKNHSDALIITGNWTGEQPDVEELKLLRKSIGNFPIIAGSGVDKNNIKTIFQFANGAIVSTSLKKGSVNKEEINTKAYNQRIDVNKVKNLVKQS
ncbi:MAG: BtpA/SgcQ family protein [Candidatus Pacebacteria bacterium]|nr:BtpA/SgcQ family protein [Candidatus Paceibacterota bacterium]